MVHWQIKPLALTHNERVFCKPTTSVLSFLLRKCWHKIDNSLSWIRSRKVLTLNFTITIKTILKTMCDLGLNN